MEMDTNPDAKANMRQLWQDKNICGSDSEELSFPRGSCLVQMHVEQNSDLFSFVFSDFWSTAETS